MDILEGPALSIPRPASWVLASCRKRQDGSSMTLAKLLAICRENGSPTNPLAVTRLELRYDDRKVWINVQVLGIHPCCQFVSKCDITAP